MVFTTNVKAFLTDHNRSVVKSKTCLCVLHH